MASTYDRASLLGLPNELRSKIYAYVFSGSYIRFHKLKGVEARIEAQLPKTWEFSPYLAAQLVSKAFYNDPSLYKMFLYASTIYVSNYDLNLMRSYLNADDFKLIRHVCIRPERREVRELLDAGIKLSRAPPNYRFECPLTSVLEIMPNIRSMTIRRDHIHINTFYHDLSFSLEALLVAADREPYTFDTLVAMKVAELGDSATAYPLTTPTTLDRQSFHLSRSYSASRAVWPLNYAKLCKKSDTVYLREFSHVLALCLKRTAEKFNHRWYYNCLYEAFENDVEILFHVELMFRDAEQPEDERHTRYSFQSLKEIEISSRDWTLQIEANGKRYDFKQVTPSGTWRQWIYSKLKQYGGPMNPKIEADAGPLSKKQRST